MSYAIGVDLGGTRVKAVTVSPQGELLDQLVRRTLDTDDTPWPQRVRDLIRGMQEAREEGAAWIGVAAPGIAAPDGRRVWWMQGRLDELEGLDWTELLEHPRPVPVINDAQAALLGEVWRGAAKGCENVVLLTLGTGVGGAAICDGRLLRGACGRAGHLGHISLDLEGPPDIVNTPGSLEDMVGNCTIERRSGGQFASTFELLEAYRAGDAEARRIWRTSVRALAAGIVSIANVLDPELVLLAGGIAGAGDALFGPLGEDLDRFEWRPHGHRVRVAPATGGELAGAFGAAWEALRTGG